MFRGVLRLTINQLILSNVYMGDSYYFINIKIKPFILGHRDGYHILNVSITHIQFKLLINFLVNLISVRKSILVVKELDFFNLKKYLNSESILYYDRKWIGGLMTNHRLVSKCSKLKKNKIRFAEIPSLLFLFNINFSKWPLNEALLLDIPIASILNSNSTRLDYVNYPLIGNNQSFESIFLYSSILKNAALKGQQKERLNIMRIL